MGLVITGLAIMFGILGVVRGAPANNAIAPELVTDAVVRASGVDLVAAGRDLPSTAQFEPPWVRGVPHGAGAIVTRGDSPLPQSDFVVGAHAGGWTRWVLADPPETPSGPRARFTFGEHLGQAIVAVGGELCDTWLFGKWQCGPNPWNYVGEAEVQVRGRMQRCIWAHPSDDGILSLEFSDVPLGMMISGRHMLGDIGVSNDEEGDIQFRVLVNDEIVGDRQQQQRAGLNTFRHTLDDAPERGTVRFEIEAEVTAQRHFCFTAQTRTQSSSSTSRPAVDVGVVARQRAARERAAEGSGAADGSGEPEVAPSGEREPAAGGQE
ncbi:MAG: hypothetical protein ACJAYU_005140 [Bradymonadia bacterium]|jgi:hypothetical protein